MIIIDDGDDSYEYEGKSLQDWNGPNSKDKLLTSSTMSLWGMCSWWLEAGRYLNSVEGRWQEQ